MSSGPKTRGSYGPTSPRGQKQAAAMQAVKDRDMAKKMQEAYERFGRSSESDSPGYKKGGKVKKMAGGGSASKRADGCAIRGKTRGKMV